MTDERWHRILRLMDEAYADYLTGLAALRKRVLGDVKCKVSDSEVLDRPDLEEPLPGRATGFGGRRRTRGRRPRC